MNIDEWAAEQCGVEIHTGYWIHNGVKHDFPWSVLHPVCREIVRGHFKLSTYWDADGHCWCESDREDLLNQQLVRDAPEIAEAEIACITAIYEAQKDE